MNKIPSVSETLALLESLKQSVRDFAAREGKLDADFHNSSDTARKFLEAQTEKSESDFATRLAEAEAALETKKNQRQSWFEARQNRVNRAHENVRNKLERNFQNQDAQWREQVQTGLAEAEQQRDNKLAASVTARENFEQKLVGVDEHFRQLEKKARRAFRISGKFRRLLRRKSQLPESIPFSAGDEFFSALQQLQTKIEDELKRFQKIPLSRFFKFVPFWPLAILLLAVAAANPVLRHFGRNVISNAEALVAFGALLVLSAISFFARRAAAPAAGAIADLFLRARQSLAGGFEKIESHFQQEQERIRAEFENNKQSLSQRWKEGVKDLAQSSSAAPTEIDEKAFRLFQKIKQRLAGQLERDEIEHEQIAAQLQFESDATAKQNLDDYNARKNKLENDHQSAWLALETDWKKIIEPLCKNLDDARGAAEKKFPEWTVANWENWTPPQDFQNVATFGRLEVDMAKFVEALPKDKRLTLPCPETISVPLSLVCPSEGSILFESAKTGGDEAVGAINNIIFRLFATTPPGKLTFTIFDPIGLGQNFASLMHLADYEDSYINSRIWTQTAQFEEKLSELNEHMEKIIQMYLRNDYATITEYNAEAGAVAEKYHFLVIASFPANFSETAARRLRNIAASGARCGVYTLIHRDLRIALPADFVPDELRKNSVCLARPEKGFELANWHPSGTRLILDAPPSDEFATHFLQQIGRTSKDSTRVEVPFEQIAPAELWTEETTEELRVPIGRSGATKFQFLAVGKGTRQHALIAGKTGSGKSTLFHIIITNLALRCSPEQVEFYLVDFKKGVEFKCYATRQLPHAKVVAIESDREFGLSVLQRVDEELRRRGDLFRKLGAQDLAGYKRSLRTTTASQLSGEPMPRVLLIIDEFQEFFVEEDRVSQGAAVLLDRIVRQGRAFGIHVLLGSQTLGGAYTLARATIGQMVIRIALQCNEADAYLIMDQDNPAPRLLSRPGEGIYNDAAGSIEGNSPFQAVWLPDTVRDAYLKKIRERAHQTPNEFPGPIVFEGNTPADVRDNLPLRAALEIVPAVSPAQARAWLGAPNSIKGPTEAVFQKQSGDNLLIVGQSDERTLTLLTVALISLAAQFPRGAARFIVLDSTASGFPQRELLERVSAAIPHEIILAGNSTLSETLSPLADELKKRGAEVGQASSLSVDDRQDACPTKEIFLLIQGIQNFKKLRQEDEFSFSSGASENVFNPATALSNLITEGPSRGIHVIATCDTYNNVSRFLGRKALSEFEMRVVFQMSASDSASLIDAPNAATLGLHRALFYNEREGRLETFRPYAQPDNGWIENVLKQM